MICSEKASALMMIARVSIYLIECQNKEEKYIAFLIWRTIIRIQIGIFPV